MSLNKSDDSSLSLGAKIVRQYAFGLNSTERQLLQRVIDKALENKQAEIDISDKLIAERNRVLDLLPCSAHGQCVPHVIDTIKRYQLKNSSRFLTILALRSAINAVKLRLAFMGHPNEPKDWSAEVEVMDRAIALSDEYDLNKGETNGKGSREQSTKIFDDNKCESDTTQNDR